MILGIDFGRVKIGLATADEKAKRPLAVPLTIIHCRSWRREAISKIVALSHEYKIDKIVIGDPAITFSGRRLNKPSAEYKDFVRLLTAAIHCPIIFFDEQISTKAAQKLTRDWPSPKRKNDDAVAAQVILQSWLDRHYA